jgi:probable O-glycosylation ligase (exosortase A-associated)
MAMRDFALVAFVLASFPVGLLVPYYGLLVYTWVSYMYPHMYAWSFGRAFPSAKLMVCATIVGAVVRRDFDFAPLRRPAMAAMMLLLAWFTLTTVVAIYPERAWPRWEETSKVILMALVSAVLLTTRQRLRFFLIVVAFSLGFYGIKGGIFSLVTGGTQMVGGAGTSVVASNNSVGLALNMCLPLMWYLAQEERGWIKRFLQAGFFLSIPAVMFTYSRASAVTLAVILLVLLLRGRRAFVLVTTLLIAGLLAAPYIPERWWNRQQTTLDYSDDGSAMTRIANWRIGWRIALDSPLTGLGFEFMSNDVFAKYDPGYLARFGKAYNTHSIYLAMLTSHGFPGFFLFMLTIGLTYIGCWSVRWRVRGRPDLKWCSTYCDIVTVGLLAFLVNGAFVNMEYFDLPYHFVATAACLSVVSQRALASESSEIGEVAGGLSPVPAA